jgi:hypothetical protein
MGRVDSTGQGTLPAAASVKVGALVVVALGHKRFDTSHVTRHTKDHTCHTCHTHSMKPLSLSQRRAAMVAALTPWSATWGVT